MVGEATAGVSSGPVVAFSLAGERERGGTCRGGGGGRGKQLYSESELAVAGHRECGEATGWDVRRGAATASSSGPAAKACWQLQVKGGAEELQQIQQGGKQQQGGTTAVLLAVCLHVSTLSPAALLTALHWHCRPDRCAPVCGGPYILQASPLSSCATVNCLCVVLDASALSLLHWHCRPDRCAPVCGGYWPALTYCRPPFPCLCVLSQARQPLPPSRPPHVVLVVLQA